MLYIGIDPGAKGALVAINGRGQIVHSLTFDNIPNISDYLIQFFQRAVKPFKHECTVYLEHAQCYGNNGAVGMFNYGMGFGEIKGTLYTLGYNFTLIRPQVWTRIVFEPHSTSIAGLEGKDRAVAVSKLLWPQESFLATKRSKVPHSGIIDAALIAHYARTMVHRAK